MTTATEVYRTYAAYLEANGLELYKMAKAVAGMST